EESRRLLLVDDEPDIVNSLKRGLEAHSLQVDGFEDPIKALASFSNGKYDLAIIDIRMPQMNGFELFREIRKIDSEVPVCFLTAFDIYQSEFAKIFPVLKPQALLRKPVSISSLLSQVSRKLESENPARC